MEELNETDAQRHKAMNHGDAVLGLGARVPIKRAGELVGGSLEVGWG